MSAPIKKFNAGSINVAVWENDSKKGNKFNTVSIQRNYKDENEKWQTSNSLRANDIPKVMLMLQKAYEYIVLDSHASQAAE